MLTDIDDDRMSGSYDDYEVSLNGNTAHYQATPTGRKRKRVADEMETVGDNYLSRGWCSFRTYTDVGAECSEYFFLFLNRYVITLMNLLIMLFVLVNLILFKFQHDLLCQSEGGVTYFQQKTGNQEAHPCLPL